MDFSLKTYNTLLNTLKDQGFFFISVEQSLSNNVDRAITLRHDVDLLPENSLGFAKIEADKGIKGTYYFRIVSKSFSEKIIKEIYSLGHEIGYHYEDMTTIARRVKGISAEEDLAKISIKGFKENLEKLRQLVPVKTICMHGSPMSRWDSRLLWKYYDYHDFGIIGEPYFDIDFDEVLYLTDTGRRWDGDLVSIRDKVLGEGRRGNGTDKFKEWKVKPVGISERTPHAARSTPFPQFHSTFDIIQAGQEGKLPAKIMMTFHPQRWADMPIPWMKELVWQNVKNVGKFLFLKMRY